MLKILTINLFYKYSMNTHHLQKMLVPNLSRQLSAIESHAQVTKDYWVHYCNKIMIQICGNWGNNTVRSTIRMFFMKINIKYRNVLDVVVIW